MPRTRHSFAWRLGVAPARVELPNRALNASFADIDNDGGVDLVAAPGGAYRQKANGRFTASGNRPAIGARVRVSSGGVTQTRWVGETEDSRLSQGQYRIYAGSCASSTVDDTEVDWPDGTVQHVAPAVDRFLQVTEVGS